MSSAVAYLRRSTGRQDTSFAAQERSIRAWAEVHGVTVRRWFRDSASGAAPLEKCPGLLAAMGAVRAGEVLVVLKRDRWARSVERAVLLEAKLRARHATLVAVEGGGNGDGPESKFLRRILDAAAELELEWIRARTAAALQTRKAARQRYTHDAPYGYRWTGAKGAERMVPVAKEQAAVAYARSLRDDGLSLRAIGRELKDAGYEPRGSAWHADTVRRMLAYVPPEGVSDDTD